MSLVLTNQQLTDLKASINADGVLVALPNTADAAVQIAAAYNLPASPAFTVWKKGVGLAQIRDALSGTELAGLSTLNHTRLQTVVLLASQAGGLDPSRADQRAFFDDIFSGSGGATTRAALLVLWKKLATRAERLFATGTGSDASPGTTATNIGNNFLLSAADVSEARNLP